MYDSDAPPFKTEGAHSDKVQYIEAIPDETIDQMDLAECRKELTKRGYKKPPYNLALALQSGTCMKVAIQDEGSNPAFLIAGQEETSASESEDVLNAIVEAIGEAGKEDFSDGVPKVKKMTEQVHDFVLQLMDFAPKLMDFVLKRWILAEQEARGLLKLIGHDPRFKDGQPIVQPSYYERSCNDTPCCMLFWFYWIGMLVVAIVALTTGDPYRLIRPIDYNGDTCGGIGLETKETMYYPQMAADALRMYQDTEYASSCADSVSGCFYGVCTDGCPSKGDYLCNYEMQVELETWCATNEASRPDECLTRKQKEYNGDGCWIVQMNSIEIFKRCLPWEATVVTTDYSCDPVRPCDFGTCTLDKTCTGTSSSAAICDLDAATDASAACPTGCTETGTTISFGAQYL